MSLILDLIIVTLQQLETRLWVWDCGRFCVEIFVHNVSRSLNPHVLCRRQECQRLPFRVYLDPKELTFLRAYKKKSSKGALMNPKKVGSLGSLSGLGFRGLQFAESTQNPGFTVWGFRV